MSRPCNSVRQALWGVFGRSAIGIALAALVALLAFLTIITLIGQATGAVGP